MKESHQNNLKDAFEEAARQDLQTLFAEEAPALSEKFQQKIDRLIRQQRRNIRGKVTAAMAYIAAAAAVIALCIVLPKLQERRAPSLLQIDISDAAAVVSFVTDGVAVEPVLEQYHALTVPDGYEFVHELQELGSLYLDWQHENGSILNFTQGPLLFGFTLYTEGCTMEQVDVWLPDDTVTKGWYFRREGFALLLWTGPDRYYRLQLRGEDVGTIDLTALAEQVSYEIS